MSGSMGGKEGKEDEEEGKGRRKEGEEERRRRTRERGNVPVWPSVSVKPWM